MTDKEIIREAYFALAGYRSPTLTRQQRENELQRCYTLLADALYRRDEEDESR